MSPADRWSVWAHLKVKGSGFSPRGWLTVTHPTPLKFGQPLPFGSRPCLGLSAFRSFTLCGHLSGTISSLGR